MSRLADRLLGNILLDDYLHSKRAPPFLKRNLDRVFRIHEHILENGSGDEVRDTYHDFRSEWKPLSWDTLDDMIALEKSWGSFRLQIHGFKPLHPNLVFIREGPNRKVRNLFSIRSKVNVTVLADSDEFRRKSLLDQEATITGKDSNHSANATVMMETMTISREDLAVDNNGLRFDTTYRLMLSVNFTSPEDVEELYKHMGCDTTRHKICKRLSASYGNILKCPIGKEVLPLTVTASKEKLSFGIEVSMYWNDIREESILSASNRQQRNSSLPTSYPSPPTETAPKFAVTFVYAEEKEWRSGKGCPHCLHTNAFVNASLHNLILHLNTYHDKFQYQVIKDGQDDAGVIQYRFVSHLPHHRTERAMSLEGEFHNHVIAPPRPFDAERFAIHGDETWQWESSGRTTTLEAVVSNAARPSLVHSASRGTKHPDEVQEIPARQQRTFTVPKAIRDGVTFFRSFTKRPLIEGETVGESDDEVDIEWADHRKTAELEKNTRLLDPMKRFLRVYDKHMLEEGVQSERCLGDALVRFVRKNAAWMWEQDVFHEFKIKMDELLEDKIIAEVVHSWCVEKVEGLRPGSRDASDLTQRLSELDVHAAGASFSNDIIHQSSNWRLAHNGKGKARVTETGHLTPITADSDGDIEMQEATMVPFRSGTAHQETKSQDGIEDPPYELCVCGQDAQVTARVLPVVTCSSMDCIRRYFHLDCLEHNSKTPVSVQDTKKRAWTCDDCMSLANINT